MTTKKTKKTEQVTETNSASTSKTENTIENLLLRYRLIKEIQDYALDCGARNTVNKYEKELNDMAKIIKELDAKA